MSKQSFNAELINSNETIKAGLVIYKFKEDNIHVIYCPSLDLSAYGKTEKEAENEFAEIFKIHITYCLNEKTLENDLIKHGWHLINPKKKKIKAPTIEEMLKNNDTLRDIIYNKDYVKTKESVEIPQFA